MSGAQINLAAVPLPNIVEALSFEAIYNERRSALIALFPPQQQAEIAQTLALESEPLAILLQESTYREIVLRQRINDAARALSLAHAVGVNLDVIAANFDVARLVIHPGDPTTIPPTPAEYEADDALRRRVQMSFESYTTAGSVGSYEFHALSADPDVKDVAVSSSAPGQVDIIVLSRSNGGQADSRLLAAVQTALNADHVRPLTDFVRVQAATLAPYQLRAELVLLPGPDSGVVLATAQAAANKIISNHQLGQDVAVSALYAALQQAGVQRVNLIEPTGNIIIGPTEAASCQHIDISIAGES